VIADSAASGGVGDRVTRALPRAKIRQARYVAVLYRDDAGNWGLLRRASVPRKPSAGKCRNLIKGTPSDDRLIGTAASDRMRGRAGDDRMKGRRGGDCILPGPGHDRVAAGSGRDKVRARGAVRDRINCGRGHDTAIVDRRDVVHRCETVRRG
jgi:hypothetical protein